MSILKKIFTAIGVFKNELDVLTLQNEMAILNEFVTKSLSGASYEDVSPELILLHTGKIKEIITTLFNKGKLSVDKNTMNYVLCNIANEEKMIESCAAAYRLGDMGIYSSQVGASLMSIQKDIKLFLR